MPAPDTIPEWALDDDYPMDAEPEEGTPTKVEPSSGKKATGWRPSEMPPAQYLNWWMWLVGMWIDWLQMAKLDFFVMHQNWCAPMFASWTATEVNGATVAKVIDAAADKPGAWLRVRVPGDAAAEGAKRSERVVAGTLDEWPDDLYAMTEFSVDSTALVGKDVIVKLGIVHDENFDPITEDAITLYRSNASPNWVLVTYSSDGAAGTSTNTGVAATGVQRMRLEVFGANWPGGLRAELRIDDVLVATNTTNMPDEQEMLLFFGFANNEVLVADLDLYISPITFITRVLE